MMGRHKEEMQKFTRLAAAIGESVEDVCNMPDEERTQLMKVMHMEDEEGAGGGTKPENEGNHSKDEVEEDTPSKRSRRGKRKPVFDALFDWNNDDVVHYLASFVQQNSKIGGRSNPFGGSSITYVGSVCHQSRVIWSWGAHSALTS